MKEDGMYDYIICNDNLESAVQHLASIAQRALAGETRNGAGTMATTLTAGTSQQQVCI